MMTQCHASVMMTLSFIVEPPCAACCDVPQGGLIAIVALHVVVADNDNGIVPRYVVSMTITIDDLENSIELVGKKTNYIKLPCDSFPYQFYLSSVPDRR